jgi:hypothetical protein
MTRIWINDPPLADRTNGLGNCFRPVRATNGNPGPRRSGWRLTSPWVGMMTKRQGNFRKGEDHHAAKLDRETVEMILSHHFIGSIRLGRLLGIDPSHIRSIRRGKKWRHIKEESRNQRQRGSTPS